MTVRNLLKTTLVAAAFTLIPLSQARAQLTSTDTTLTGDYAGNSGAQVTVQFTASLQNAVQLTLDGLVGTAVGGGPTAGTVGFGNFNTLCSTGVTTGACVPTTTGTAGAHLVGQFRAGVAFSGAASADMSITRNGTVTDSMPVGGAVKFAAGTGNAWTNSATGGVIPAALTAENNLGAAVASGATVDHEVALFFPSTSAVAAYQATVRWTATTN